MKVKLVGGPKDGQTIICPDDSLTLVLLAEIPGKLKDHDRYDINHGIGSYQEKEDQL